MSVDFGSARETVFGKTKLTKRVQGGFGLSTRLGLEELWTVATEVCDAFPRDRKQGVTVYRARGDKKRTIGFGRLSSDGSHLAVSADWTLRISEVGPPFIIFIYIAKLTSGKIRSVLEMQHFLNELEAAVRKLDPSAELVMIVPE